MKPFPLTSGLFLIVGALPGQQYVISTIAGGGPPPNPINALSLRVGAPQGVATDSAGNLYFTSLNCVFKVDPNGVMTRVAGNSRAGYSGDGGPAPNAQLAGALAVAVDAAGNLFIADTNNHRIRRVSTSGVITTVAGNGVNGYLGDGGPAVSAWLANPTGVAVDGSGNIYFADTTYNLIPAMNNRVRMVSPNGIISTVAGNGTFGASGDGGPAIGAQLANPAGIAIDAAGNLYVADTQDNRVRKVSANGIISTVAGNGTIGFSGDNGPAVGAQLSYPNAVAVDGSGNLFIADAVNNRIRKVAPNGIITTVAGSVRCCGSAGDGGPATAASLVFPTGVAVDSSGSFFIADSQSGIVRKVSADGIIATLAGSGTSAPSGDDGPALNAQLSAPNAVAADGEGNVYVADYNNNRVRRISKAGVISTVAGNGTAGSFSGDGGLATGAAIWGPDAVAVDGSGNLFIADNINRRIRKVSTSGIITTVAGNGNLGFSGDGGPATKAAIWNPYGIAVDPSGNLFIADNANGRVRKVSTNGIITTVAGGGNSTCCDGGPATSAGLGSPYAIAVDGSGNLFIADWISNSVRKVDAAGIITTVGGPISGPNALAADGSGNVFVADSFSDRVWKTSPDGSMIPVAGNGSGGYSGDGGFATSAQLYLPIVLGLNKFGLAVDGAGQIFIADSGNNAVRVLTPTPQSVLINAVVDAASERSISVSPGKAVTIYGAGLGPSLGVAAAPANGAFATQLSGTTVSFNGVAAPVLYSSSTQVNAVVPYSISGTAANVAVAYQGQTSASFAVSMAASSPGLFTLNGTGAGEAASINAKDSSVNSAANPARVGDYISLYATGEGQTTPAGVDGKLATVPLPSPNLAVSATVDGIPAVVQYKGGVFGAVAGLMQLNVQIPLGATPGGYVPVTLQVGGASTVDGAVWIAVSAK
jgi:uncharacterized protein (TIGR03437 family)